MYSMCYMASCANYITCNHFTLYCCTNSKIAPYKVIAQVQLIHTIPRKKSSDFKVKTPVKKHLPLQLGCPWTT